MLEMKNRIGRQNKEKNRNQKYKEYHFLNCMLIMVLLILFGCLSYTPAGKVYAAENKVSEDEAQPEILLRYINADTPLYENADETSGVLSNLPQRAVVMLLADDGVWCEVQVSNVRGYVQSVYLQEDSTDEALDKEISEQSEYNTAFVDELERLRAEKRRSKIFGIIIVVLIAAIFGVGIVTTIRAKKKNADDKSEITSEK